MTVQMPANHYFPAILSPCVGVCHLDQAGLCTGCRRTAAEIAAWSTMDDASRMRVIDSLASRGDGAAS
ncbi:MAG: DUF1289 domain-containing protein [Pseudomonadota bacterium]|nr:DUF1289 domain-containing protein [Pseudomonadota bacterium]